MTSPSIPMLERCASAIALVAVRKQVSASDLTRWSEAQIAAFVDHRWKLWLPEARAALSALIPPSEEMVKAMVAAIFDAGEMPNAPDSLKAAFTAAIQAVLAEGEGTPNVPS